MRKLIQRVTSVMGVWGFALGVAVASPKSNVPCPVDNLKCSEERWESIQTRINGYPYWKSFELFDWAKQLKRSIDISAYRAIIAYESMNNKENAYCTSLKLINYINSNPVFSSEQNASVVITPEVMKPCQAIEE